MDMEEPEDRLLVPSQVPRHLVTVYRMAVDQKHALTVFVGNHREMHDPLFLFVGDQVAGF